MGKISGNSKKQSIIMLKSRPILLNACKKVEEKKSEYTDE